MPIYRSQSRLTVQRKRQRGGCVSLLLSLGLIVGTAGLAVLWFVLRGGTPEAPTPDLLYAAAAAFNQGDLDHSIVQARRLLAQPPEAPEAYGALVQLLARALVYRSYSDYNRTADRQSALEVTEEAYAKTPTNAQVAAAHAFALAVNGQPADSAEIARRILEEQPNYTLARTALALAYGAAGAHEQALRESLQAVETARGGAALDPLRALAIAYSDMGNYLEAGRTVEVALGIHNRLLTLYFERALYAMQLGDTDGATVAYYQVLVHAPDNVKARMRLCELSSLLRERDAAVDYCTQVTTRAPSWSDGWYQLGREYFLQGNWADAQRALHRCSSLQVMQSVPVAERRFECWYLQGQAAELVGDCQALIATYNEFRAMTADEGVRETWTYPPEGPSC